ncbi:hypothetical protein VTL71DRAFT_5729 [Oculimacula yallundae]|uniref:Uncharacterized protein n=1 Tax=Oculimacula yallundae TaxID=86028 RepID=A0ABR4BZA4_9HELO
MKFGKELERTLVPEWRPKYFDYRQGKKRVNIISGLIGRLDKITTNLSNQSRLLRSTPLNALKKHEIDPAGDISLCALTEQIVIDTNDEEAALVQRAPSSRASIPHLITNDINLFQTQEYYVKMTEEVNDQIYDQEKQFSRYLEGERDKIESFYKLKENEATQRFRMLKCQLQEMHVQREVETAETESSKKNDLVTEGGRLQTRSEVLLSPLTGVFEPQQTATTDPMLNARQIQSREYLRQDSHKVSYDLGKRQLRAAVQEFYRALHMLKEYSTLNKKAFEKINKKFSKVAGRRSSSISFDTGIYDSYFVRSTLIDTYITEAEDAYQRYFENGNHKVAARKLRASIQKLSDGTLDSFTNGIMSGIAVMLLTQAIYNAVKMLQNPDHLVHLKTRLLLQIYGGYFLMLYLFILFCLSCRIWKNNHINYTFIFEFNRRHTLPVAKLSQYPISCLLLLAGFMWLNFYHIGAEGLVYWPTTLVAATILLMFFPAPILAPKSRKWFILSHFRLLFAGLNPVEFRDVFLGDMYTSLSFPLGNIGFFFCIYAINFLDETTCDSTNIFAASLLAGLPAVLRLLQCFRRYFDSKVIFPHLVNAGKYAVSILFTLELAFYRLDGGIRNLILLVIIGTISALYASIWDLLMDFSLLDPDSSLLKPALRPVRVFKSKRIYYIIAILDIVLRCTWIFSVFFPNNVLVNFLVGFGEVTRRGMWMVLRVENEHCSNVGGLKAYRVLDLPYNLITREQSDKFQLDDENIHIEAKVEMKRPNRWSILITEAHRQDFTYNSNRRDSQDLD